MNRLQLHESTGTPSLSTLDNDTTTVRGRRRRMLAVAVAAAAAVTGLSLVTYLGPTNSPPPVAPAPETVGPAQETAPEKAARLSHALESLVAGTLPDATVDPLEFRIVRADPSPETAPFNTLETSAVVRDGAGVGSVSVVIGRRNKAPDGHWWCADAHGKPLPNDGVRSDCAVPAAYAGGPLNLLWSCMEVTGDRLGCTRSTGPHGEYVIAIERRWGASVRYEVDVARTDGTAIILVSTNSPPAAAGESAPPTRPEPPLSLDQLVAIGTDPSLNLRP
jgi:hypothetical protein